MSYSGSSDECVQCYFRDSKATTHSKVVHNGMLMEKVPKFTETIRSLQKPRGSSKFYRDSEPTNNKVLALLKADQKNDAERDSFKYLQQYTCGLEQVQLLKFLRFVTGADIVSGITMISVNFIKIQGFQRRPVAHTCGPLPELPNSY